MAKADSNGVYRIGKAQYKVRKGDPIPDDAEFTATADEPTEERAKKAAPENKSKQDAPENRAKGK